ncbi:unnamed protein product [Paramecium pentaurelia]|uniref:Uncharacterized protein n=1 Tax=Paramecium pentaurelia TaxID=43138 RepID=A0A8S1VCB2_9CILI|nr:unnamed protein product [Paramecium pentaurelia]
MNQYMRIKPVFATFYPDQCRNHSKENRISSGYAQSRMEDKSQSVDKFKNQVILLQNQQNDLNEHMQMQISKLMERMNNAEQHIARIYESGWMDAINIVQEDMHKLQLQLQSVQQMIIVEEEKSQQFYIEQINQMKYTVLDQINSMDQEINVKIEDLRIKLDEYNQEFKLKLVETNDIDKYQRFNEEMSIYLKNNNNNQNLTLSPKYKSRSQKLSLPQINELDDSQQLQSFQFLQSQSLQYQLDNEGHLLLNGEYIYDSVGNKQQLSNDQIKYINLIPK